MKRILSRSVQRSMVVARAQPGTVGVVILLLLFFFYSVQRTMATTEGYRLGRLQEERRRLLNKNHYLRWERVRVVSREALEQRAQNEGLRMPQPAEETLVVVKDGA